MKVLSALAAAALACGIVGAWANDWRLYQNERYGTTIEYPPSFKPLPPIKRTLDRLKPIDFSQF